MSHPIAQFMQIPSSFLLFIAPPAWGKTRLIHQLLEDCTQLIVYISPLRALLEEFQSNFSANEIIRVKGKDNSKELINKAKSFQIKIVMGTVEVIRSGLLIGLSKIRPLFVILDEFHLFYRWGFDFRPQLWDLILDLGTMSIPTLGLTATCDDQGMDIIKNQIPLGFEESYILTIANLTLKNKPKKIFDLDLLQSLHLENFLAFELMAKPKDKTLLVFAQYRNEVKELQQKWTALGFSCLGCLGGEVMDFCKKLAEKGPRPDIIFATSALSHGVNLPPLHAIFINYELNDKEFWIQMVGRGGRKGEAYLLYHVTRHLPGFRLLDGVRLIGRLLMGKLLLTPYRILRKFQRKWK